MRRQEQRHCQHCGEKFTPDRRNGRHQKYCSALPCKAASKKASQAKWLAKNPDYHCGPEAVARVQAWRQAHPGYCRANPGVPVQESLPFETAADAPTLAEVLAPPKTSCNAPESAAGTPLQDLLSAQPIVLVGLIAHIWGSALQEDIASALTRLIQLGHDIRGGGHEYYETNPEPGAPAAGCLKGMTALFTTAVDIVNSLAAAQATGGIKREMARLLKPTILCIDELGYPLLLTASFASILGGPEGMPTQTV